MVEITEKHVRRTGQLAQALTNAFAKDALRKPPSPVIIGAGITAFLETALGALDDDERAQVVRCLKGFVGSLK